jgi:hypothetical protein
MTQHWKSLAALAAILGLGLLPIGQVHGQAADTEIHIPHVTTHSLNPPPQAAELRARHSHIPLAIHAGRALRKWWWRGRLSLMMAGLPSRFKNEAPGYPRSF